MHLHNAQTLATVPPSTSNACASPLKTTKQESQTPHRRGPPTNRAHRSIHSPSDFANSLHQGTIPISVSDRNLRYGTTVVTDHALKRIDCCVYRPSEAAERLLATSTTPSTTPSTATVQQLTTELQDVRARLNVAETAETVRLRYELPSRTLKALDAYILFYVLNGQQRMALHTVRVYTSVTTVRELCRQFLVDRERGLTPAMTDKQEVVESIWTNPEVTNYHALYDILQNDKNEVGPDRHEVAHPIPSRAAFCQYALDLGVSQNLANELALQTQALGGESVPLFLI